METDRCDSGMEWTDRCNSGMEWRQTGVIVEWNGDRQV